MLVQLAYYAYCGRQLLEALEMPQYVHGGVQQLEVVVAEREVGYAVVRIVVHIVLTFRHHYGSVVSQPVATHQGDVVLESAPAYGVAASFKLGESLCAGFHKVVDSPAAEAVLQAAVDGGDAY